MGEEYLELAGDRLSGLREVFFTDPALKEVARSPLMLSVMSLAYANGTSTPDVRLFGGTGANGREHIFSRYVNRMLFGTRNLGRKFTPEKTMGYLTWLAREMRKRSTIFSIEDLQPSWLADERQRYFYIYLSRLLAGSVCATCLAIPLYLAFVDLRASAMILAGGALSGCLAGYVDSRQLKSNASNRGWRGKIFRLAIAVFAYPLLCACLFGAIATFFPSRLERLVLGLDDLLALMKSDAHHLGPFEHLWLALRLSLPTMFVGLLPGLWFGTLFLIKTPDDARNSDIRLKVGVDLTRSTPNRKRAFIFGAIFGLAQAIVGYIFIANTEPKYRSIVLPELSNPVDMAISLAESSLFWGVTFLAIRWISSAFVSSTGARRGLATRPGAGVALTAKSAVLAAALVGTVTLAVALISSHYLVISIIDFDFALKLLACLLVIPATLYSAMWSGGFDVLKHVTLCMLLQMRGCMPGKYVQFLEHATRLILLRRVGSGYIFIHRLFLEYFSELNIPQQPRAMPTLPGSTIHDDGVSVPKLSRTRLKFGGA
jgi:eukaryotic-like serine/threonine-protein kinase